MNESNIPEYEVYYLSTQKAMSEARFNQIKLAFCNATGLGIKDFDFLIIRCHITSLKDYEHVIESEIKVKLTNPAAPRKVKLVVVDSISGLVNNFISVTSVGTSSYNFKERNLFLRKSMNSIKAMAEKHGVCVVFTNNVRAEIDEGKPETNREKLVPAGGGVWSLLIHERYFLKKRRVMVDPMSGVQGESFKRTIKVHFGPRFKGKEKMLFALTDAGLEA